MNLARLVTLAKMIKEDADANDIAPSLGRLAKQIKQVIEAPNEENQRTAVNSLEDLKRKLAASKLNALSPAYKADLLELAIEGMPVEDLVGEGLRQQLIAAVQQGIMHVDSLDRVKILVTLVNAVQESLQQARTGLERLEIGPEQLDPGESVVGMTIPRREAKSFASLQDELDFLRQFIDALTECVEGRVDENEVMTLRSSEFGIDVKASLDVVKVFALIVTGVKKALDTLRKYRDMKKQMAEVQLDEPEIVERLDEAGTKAMEKAIDDLHLEVMRTCKVDDKNRVHEVTTNVKLRINGVANRMERGFIFEARVALPPSATDEQRQAEEVVSALAKLEFKAIDGPRILALPESTTDPLWVEPTGDAKPNRGKGTRNRHA